MLKDKDHSKQNITSYIVNSIDVEEETEMRFEGVEVYGIQWQTLGRLICGYTTAYKINIKTYTTTGLLGYTATCKIHINTYQSEKKTDFIE